MQPEDRVRLRHMKDAAETALGFIAGRNRRDLDTDQLLFLGLARAIEIVGEGASKVSLESRRALPAIPWPEIISMRHRLAHAYMDIERDVLWQTVVDDMPVLLGHLRDIELEL
jgi:uncharacterized protein with HEPN domain